MLRTYASASAVFRHRRQCSETEHICDPDSYVCVLKQNTAVGYKLIHMFWTHASPSLVFKRWLLGTLDENLNTSACIGYLLFFKIFYIKQQFSVKSWIQNHYFQICRIYFILDSHNFCLFWIDKLGKSWTRLFKIEYFTILNAEYTCADAEHTGVDIEHMCTKLNTRMLKLNACAKIEHMHSISEHMCSIFEHICSIFEHMCSTCSVSEHMCSISEHMLNTYLHVFYIWTHVFYIWTHVFYISTHVFYIWTYVFYISTHVSKNWTHAC